MLDMSSRTCFNFARLIWLRSAAALGSQSAVAQNSEFSSTIVLPSDPQRWLGRETKASFWRFEPTKFWGYVVMTAWCLKGGAIFSDWRIEEARLKVKCYNAFSSTKAIEAYNIAVQKGDYATDGIVLPIRRSRCTNSWWKLIGTGYRTLLKLRS